MAARARHRLWREAQPVNLNSKYPPIPENAPKFADDIVEAAAELDHVTLTFASPASGPVTGTH